jgi:Tol biopolymer transport system component
MRALSFLVGAAAMSAVALTACEPAAPPAVTTKAVASANGTALRSTDPVITPDGRYVAFWSVASNVVPGGVGGPTEQLYRLDRTTGTTIQVSVNTAGQPVQGAGAAIGHNPAEMSDDGRYIVWGDIAANLAPGDGAAVQHVYLRDVVAGTTSRIDNAPGGAPANGHSPTVSISANGAWIAFDSVATNLVPNDSTDKLRDVFRVNRATGEVVKVSVGRTSTGAAVAPDGNSQLPIALDDGRVVMESRATNLAKGQTLGNADSIIYLMTPGIVPVVVVSATNAGGVGYGQLKSASPDGRFVTFTSYTNYSGKGGSSWLRDTVAGTVENTILTTDGKGGGGADPVVTSDGRYVAVYSGTSFTGEDLNGAQVAQVRDRTTGRVWIASRVGSKPGYVNRVGGITRNGTTVVFDGNTNYTTPAEASTKAWIATAKL